MTKETVQTKPMKESLDARISSSVEQMVDGVVLTAQEAAGQAWRWAIVGGVIGAGTNLLTTKTLQKSITDGAVFGATIGGYIGREHAIQKVNKTADFIGLKKVTFVDRVVSYLAVGAILDYKKPAESITRADRIVTMLLANAITIRGARRLVFGN